MITKQEIFEGLYGAWRLLLGDRGAVALFDDSVAGFWKSFFAAILVLPIYLVMTTMGLIEFDSSRSLPAIVLIVLEFYIIAWVLWPLIIGHVLPVLDRVDKFTLYIVAYNWMSAVGAGLFFIAVLVTTLLPIPDGFTALIMVGALLGVLAYHVFIAQTTLSITIGVAIGLTVADFILHEIVQGVMFGRLS
jgi:hypothetical protein